MATKKTSVRKRNRATNVKKADVGTTTVRRTNYDGTVVEDLGTVNVPLFDTEPARLRVSGGITRSIGDYNFVKVEVSLELPVLPEVSELERVYGIATKWVAERVERELNNAMDRDGPDDANQEERNEGGAAAAGICRQVQL